MQRFLPEGIQENFCGRSHYSYWESHKSNQFPKW